MPESNYPDSVIHCRGLREDNPRDFLAALGLLRIASALWSGEKNVRLGWTAGGWPFLAASPPLERDWYVVVADALRAVETTDRDGFRARRVLKSELAKFRARIESIRQRGQSAMDDLALRLHAAFASQTHDAAKNETTVSGFSFSNGQGGKELLRDVCDLIRDEFTADNLEADLQGSRRRPAKTLRWNPAENRTAAYRAHDPGGGVKGDDLLDSPCANVLAFLGLSFYPVADRGREAVTLGISGSVDQAGFRWPVWASPLAPDVVASLLHHPCIHGAAGSAGLLAATGISAVWCSRRLKIGTPPAISLYFSPARRVA